MTMKTIEFAVNRVTPSNGAVDFRTNDKIKITFAHHMKKETIEDPKKIQILDDGKQVVGNYTYTGIEKTLVIDQLALSPGATHQIIVRAKDEGPETIFGEKLAREYVSSFTTAKETPEAPEEPTDPEEDDEGIIPPEEGEGPVEVIDDPFENEVDRVYLADSFPQQGDLLDIGEPLVFVFSQAMKPEDFTDNIFIKKSSMHRLVEQIKGNELIKGNITTLNGEEKDNTILFSPNTPLETGQEYQVVIKKEADSSMTEDVRITFHTLFQRMFADVETVRLVLGRFADRLTDLEIAKLINQQSNSVYQLASMMDTFEEADWVESNGVITRFPYPASQYVVYSTAYYSILGQSLETSSGLSESIKLADLSVSGSSEVSDNLSDLLKSLKDEIDRWWNVLQGEPEEIEPGVPNPNYSMGTATRGGVTSPYPDFQTRVPFEDIGGGG